MKKLYKSFARAASMRIFMALAAMFLGLLGYSAITGAMVSGIPAALIALPILVGAAGIIHQNSQTNAFTAQPACSGCPTGDCGRTTFLKRTLSNVKKSKLGIYF